MGILNLVREWVLEGALEYHGEEERQRGQTHCGSTKANQLSQVDSDIRDKQALVPALGEFNLVV